MAGGVAVLVGGGRGQGDAVGGQADAVVRIARIAVFDRTHLIQGDHTAAGDADGEHGHAAGRGFTHDVAGGVGAQHNGFTGSDVDQAAGAVGHGQGVGGAARTVRTVGHGEGAGEAGAGVGRQAGFVHGQGRCRGAAGGDGW